MLKRCPKCKETKHIDDFHYSSYAKSKRQTYCKVCQNNLDRIKRERRKANGPTIHRTEKKCLKCNETKPINDFGIRRDAPDWHLPYCKPCWVVYVQSRQEARRAKSL